MKVFDLACEHEHKFEGWFASGDAYDQQHAQGLVQCPMCGSRAVARRPSAPRLNLSSKMQQAESGDSHSPERLQAVWIQLARHIVAHTEDVGERFADEARRIHNEESPARAIRGVATAEQTSELRAEGIEVLRFPMPISAKEPLQ
jgi:hypothetical protein